MVKWDLTTAEGREALERFLMERMGWRRVHLLSLPGYMREDGRTVVDGWIFTGDGMVALKRWAARSHGLIVWSYYDPLFERGVATVYEHVKGRGRGEVGAEGESAAVALALARALEEMDSQAGGAGS